MNPPSPAEGRFQSGKVAAISLAHLSHDIFSSFLAPLLPLLITKLGLSLSAVAILDIARKIPQLLNPLIGLLADRICVKYLVILTPAVTAICMSFLGVAPSFPVLFILLFVSGLSAAAFLAVPFVWLFPGSSKK
jgi:FSR family fosmidomycin resistance protein-like MFS transporter